MARDRKNAPVGSEDMDLSSEVAPVAEMSRSRANVVERIQQMNSELERLMEERDGLTLRLDQETGHAEDLSSKLNVTGVELNATRKELSLQREERDALALRLEKEAERAEEGAAKLKMIEVELSAARKESELQREEKGKLQGERSKLQDEMRRLRSELEGIVRSKQRLDLELKTAKGALQDIERAFDK